MVVQIFHLNLELIADISSYSCFHLLDCFHYSDPIVGLGTEIGFIFSQFSPIDFFPSYRVEANFTKKPVWRRIRK